MRELFSAAFAVLSARRQNVAIVAVLLGIPAAALANASPASVNAEVNSIVLGAATMVLGTIVTAVLVGVLLAELRPAQIPATELRRRVRRGVPKILVADLVLALLVVLGGALLLLAFVGLGGLVGFDAATAARLTQVAVVAGYFAVMLPFNLIVPIVVAEGAGSLDAIRWAWEVARPRFALVCLSIGGVQLVAYSASFYARAAGPVVGFFGGMCVSVASAVVQAGLLAVLYTWLVPEVTAPDAAEFVWTEPDPVPIDPWEVWRQRSRKRSKKPKQKGAR